MTSIERRVKTSKQCDRRVRLTIGRSCCRWPCLQICLQSFWLNLDENAKVGNEWYVVLSCIDDGCERKFDMWWAKDGWKEEVVRRMGIK